MWLQPPRRAVTCVCDLASKPVSEVFLGAKVRIPSRKGIQLSSISCRQTVPDLTCENAFSPMDLK